MMPGKWLKIKVEGVEYSDVTSASKVYNLKSKKVRDRLRSGWSIDEAFELISRKKRVYKNLIINNRKFKSVQEACLIYGIEPNLVNSRLRKGWSTEESFNLIVRSKGKKGVPKSCTILGKNFNSKKERNQYFGFQNKYPDLIDKRILRGWSEREAVGLEKRRREKIKWSKSATIKGKSFPDTDIGEFKLYVITNIANKKEYIGITISDLKTRLRGHLSEAKSNLKTKNKFHRAINKYGIKNFKISLIRNDAINFYDLGLQEINEIKLRRTIKIGYNTSVGGDVGTSKFIIVNNKKFASYSSVAEYYNIEPYLFNQRLKHGWTPEEAVLTEGGRGIQKVKFKGTVYGSLKKACEIKGLNYKTIHKRIVSGLSLEEAFLSEDRRKLHKINLKGKVYSSLRKACEMNGLKYTTVYKRINSGWTVEQAFEFTPRLESKYRKTPKKS